MNLWNKYKSMPIQAKASIWYTICNFFQKGISFVVVPIYIRLLSTAEYGEWSVFQSWRDILIVFASLNLYAGVYTKTLVDNKKDRDRYTASMQGLGTLVTIGMLIVYGLVHNWFNAKIGLPTSYVLLLFLYFIVYPAFSFWGTRQRVEYKYKSMIVVTIVISILTPAVSIFLLHTTDLRSNALVLGYLIVQCLIGLVFYIYHYLRGRCFYDKGYWEYALKFNVPLIPHYLSLIVLGQSDRIMIKHYCGESDAGIYSFAYQIASAMTILLSAINGSRVPWMYEQLKIRIYDRLKTITNVLCGLIGAITLLIVLLAPDIISIIGTVEYSQATYVIPIVVLGVYFTFVYDVFCGVEFYYGATKYVMVASVIGAISNIILNAILIPRFGFIAAAYTTLASYILFMFMHYVYMHKTMKTEEIHEEIFDIRFIWLFSFGLSFLTFVGIVTYSSSFARYIFILLLLLLMMLFRKQIIHTIMMIKRK